MKNISKIVALLSAALLLGAGCAPKAAVDTSVQVQPAAPEAPAPAGKEAAGTFIMMGARFHVAHPDWTVIQEDAMHVKITTATTPYVVKLTATGRATDVEMPDLVLKKDGIEVRNDFCAPGYGCYSVKTAKGLFWITWDVESTEPVPSDLDGVYSPAANFRPDDVHEIMLTAEPAS